MSITDCFKILSLGKHGSKAAFLLRIHVLYEALEQGQQVVWPGARFRVTLEAECRPVLERDALQRAVEQGAMRGLDIVRQRILGDGKAVVLARDHDLPCREVLDRVIRPVVAELHLLSPRAARECQQLVAETDTKDLDALVEKDADRLDRIVTRFRVAGTVGEKYAVGRQ